MVYKSVQCMLMTTSGGSEERCLTWDVLFLHFTLSPSLCFPEQFLDHFINCGTIHIIAVFIKGCTAIV